MGYTPLFDSLTRGTLYGRWPDIGLWPIVLALADKNGVVDATHQVIAGISGLPVSEVEACMRRFCEPDPHSRTKVEGGRRLVLVDPDSTWGWRVVNHAYYREKARLQAQNAAQVADGRNAEKVRRYKERHLDTADTAGHPETPSPNANANSNPLREEDSRGGWSRTAPEDFSPDLEVARRLIPDIDAEAEAQRFKNYDFGKPRRRWPQAWANWIQRCKDTGWYAKKDAIKWT